MLSRGAVYVPPCSAYAKAPLIDPDGWGSLGWPQVGEFGWPPGTGVPRAWMYFITYLAQLTPYIAPAMLIVFETVMVLDALGVSHVLTPSFVAAAASRIAP